MVADDEACVFFRETAFDNLTIGEQYCRCACHPAVPRRPTVRSSRSARL